MKPLSLALLATVPMALTPPAAAQLEGTVQVQSFSGPTSGLPVDFAIYLPAEYASDDASYPVIYHLHGAGGSHLGPHLNFLPANYEAARSQDLIGPAILVFPNGYTNSMYADSSDPERPAESQIIRELVPYVDANFRTLAHREARGVQGFSMGGFGAALYASKFPELFCAAAMYDAALHDWESLLLNQPEIAQDIYGNSEAQFDEYSPWTWSEANALVLQDRTAFRGIIGGDLPVLPTMREFRDHLWALGLDLEYVETGLPHFLPALLQVEGAQTWAFLEQHLNRNASLGSVPCTSQPNSSGFAGGITALGSDTVADNDLTLVAHPLPTGQFGLFYYGTSTVQQAFGNGTRCVGGILARLPIGIVDGAGVLSHEVDLTAPAQAATIGPGTTRVFQAWFRDPPAGGAVFNLSAAVELTFE